MKEKKTLTHSKISAVNLHSRINNNIYLQDNCMNNHSTTYKHPSFNKVKTDFSSNFHANFSNNYSKITYKDKNLMERLSLKDYEQNSNRVYSRTNNTKEILENLH